MSGSRGLSDASDPARDTPSCSDSSRSDAARPPRWASASRVRRGHPGHRRRRGSRARRRRCPRACRRDTGTPRAWRDAPLAVTRRTRRRCCAGRARWPWGLLGLAAGRARAKWVLLDDLDQRDDLVARDPVGELGMVAAEMLQREVDDLSLGLAADDLAALACDLPGHGWVSRAIVGFRPFTYVGAKVGPTLDNTYVQLCGRFVVE